MPFTAIIKVSQGADCSRFTVKDESDYAVETKPSFTSRELMFYDQNGTLIRTVDFSFASYPTDEYTYEGLEWDVSYTVKLKLTPATPVTGSLYESLTAFALVCYTYSAYYNRIQEMRIDQTLERNSDFIRRSERMLQEARSAVQAATEGDTVSAYNAIQRAKAIYNDPNR
jgi:hypothetical protein